MFNQRAEKGSLNKEYLINLKDSHRGHEGQREDLIKLTGLSISMLIDV